MNRSILLILWIIFLGTSFVFNSANASNQVNVNQLVAAGIHPKALKVAIKAYDWALTHGKIHKHILTLIDYTQPSVKKRMWTIDMNTGKILYTGLVSHGKNSGFLYATRFSNRAGSRASSIGAYTTDNLYSGHHGLSLRLSGLEAGVNNHAMGRAIVFHSAWYATPAFARQHNYLGRSWGCFAVNPKRSRYLFETIKGGSLVFAYAKQENHDPRFMS